MERLHSWKFVCAVHLEYQYPSYHVTCINLERCDKPLFLFYSLIYFIKALHKEREYKCSMRPKFLNLHTIDVLDQITNCCGGLSLALQDGGQSPWSLLTRCQEPPHPLKGVSKHCQMFPVGWSYTSWQWCLRLSLKTHSPSQSTKQAYGALIFPTCGQ